MCRSLVCKKIAESNWLLKSKVRPLTLSWIDDWFLSADDRTIQSALGRQSPGKRIVVSHQFFLADCRLGDDAPNEEACLVIQTDRISPFTIAVALRGLYAESDMFLMARFQFVLIRISTKRMQNVEAFVARKGRQIAHAIAVFHQRFPT
jgi:hypothetical protein